MVKGIIFDFWGTLVENGIHPSPVNQVKFILRARTSFRDFVVRFEEAMMTKEYSDLNESFQAVCDEFKIRQNPYIVERLVGMWNKNELLAKPFFETVEVLEYLKKEGYKIGLISNTNPTIMRVIEKFDLHRHFDAEVFSYQEGLLKNNTEMFKRLLEKMELSEEDVVMVGDSIQTDIIGARNAGIRAILVDRMNKRAYHPKVRNLKEIMQMVENGEFEEFASKEPTEIVEEPKRR